MVENRPFTSENLELVNRIEWDKNEELSLLVLGPELQDVARICWPTQRGGTERKREATAEEVKLTVTFLEAITGLCFIRVVQEENDRVVWFIKSDD